LKGITVAWLQVDEETQIHENRQHASMESGSAPALEHHQRSTIFLIFAVHHAHQQRELVCYYFKKPNSQCSQFR
jgi:hypothetical protein